MYMMGLFSLHSIEDECVDWEQTGNTIVSLRSKWKHLS